MGDASIQPGNTEEINVLWLQRQKRRVQKQNISYIYNEH